MVTSSFMPPRIQDRHWEIVSWLQCFIVQRAEFVFDSPSCMAGLNSCMQLGSFFFLGWQIIFLKLLHESWSKDLIFCRERGSTLILMLTRFPQHLFWPTIKKTNPFYSWGFLLTNYQPGCGWNHEFISRIQHPKWPQMVGETRHFSCS